MNTIANQVLQFFNLESIFARLLEWVPKLFAAALVMLVFLAVWRIARRSVEMVIRRAKLDATIGALIQSVLKTVLLTIGVVSALGKVGVDIAGLLTGLGVVGLTIGFAAKDTLSNMISGIFILWDRPFTIGDLVEIGGAYGRVDSITMRTTRVVTVDGRMLAIPNSEIVNKTVASYTNFPNLRLDVAFTVAVTENLSKVRQVALSVCGTEFGLMQEPAPFVVVTSLNDYNVAMQLSVWLDDERSHIAARFALRERLFEALRAAGVDMPFETLAFAPNTQVKALITRQPNEEDPS